MPAAAFVYEADDPLEGAWPLTDPDEGCRGGDISVCYWAVGGALKRACEPVLPSLRICILGYLDERVKKHGGKRAGIRKSVLALLQVNNIKMALTSSAVLQE
jgi:hypothetical protein